jgi:uncharacterized protein
MQGENYMLIRFRVKNFMSFKDEIEFSMVAGKVQKHPEHVIKKINNRGVDLLRSALIYGANASGKSNLIKAIEFAQRMIVDGVKAKSNIPRKPFKLDPSFVDETSKFEFEILVNEKIYAYGFLLDSKRIHKEWLREVRATTEKEIYCRTTTVDDENEIVFSSQINTKEINLMKMVSQTTPTNRLFLRESIERNIKSFTDIYDWFRKSLTIIYPSSFHNLSQIGSGSAGNFSDSLVKYLGRFSTGICGYSIQKIEEPSTEIPQKILDELLEDLENEHGATLISEDNKQRFFIKKEAEKLIVSKLLLSHKDKSSGIAIPFGMEEESDGTVRLLDLIPILFPTKRNKVIFIDELDRSLHPSLSYEFISLFLSENAQKQLIVTTHEANLLDLDLVRRDEIWFVEKDPQGNSNIYSLEEFSPRYDKDIRKGYMLGRFGAIPMLGKPNITGE